MELSFTDDENWGGLFYELYVELGPHPESLPMVAPALDALWAHETLDGPYGDGTVEPAAQPKVSAGEYVSEDAGHMLGMATLPDGSRVPCGCVVHIPNPASTLALPKELTVDFGPDPLEPGEDAFTFYVPYPALDQVYGVNWEDDSLPAGVEEQLDAWLLTIAQSIRGRVPYALSAIGPEGSYNPERLRGD